VVRVRLYPQQASVFPGEALRLCVSTDRDGQGFHVDFYRQGETLVWMGRLAGQVGQHAPDGPVDADWEWPPYVFPVPGDWPSGAYVALLSDGGGTEVPPVPPVIAHGDYRDSRALFVVKSADPGRDTCILFKVALNTYQAYNFTGGGSLYTWANVVSMRRPGGGLGGLTTFTPETGGCCGDDDVYDPTTLRQTFGHWEARFIAWLERAGMAVDYCTDVDIHCEATVPRPLLGDYELVLCVGHDEYWSVAMRANLTSFRDRGGNIAIFSGNTCYRQVEFLTGQGQPTLDPAAVAVMHRPGTWRAQGDPENGLTGASYDNAGGWWSRKRVDGNPTMYIDNCSPDGVCDSSRDAIGFTVEQAGHWVFAGTGLQDGDSFGEADYLVGYECDGAIFQRVNGVPVPTGTDGTPTDFLILATAPLRFDDDPTNPGWEDSPQGNRIATMVLETVHSGGTVFNAATTDWVRVLDTNATVDTITRNVLERLATTAVRISGPWPAHCGRNVAVVCPPGDFCPTVRFKIDPATLPPLPNLHYHWTISAGSAQPQDQPYLDAAMPDQPIPVTVTVSGDDGAGCGIFGTLTFTPLTPQQFEWFSLWCELQHIGLLGHPARQPLEGVGPDRRFFVDPLWDPLRDGLDIPLSRTTLNEIQRRATRILELAHQLNQHLHSNQ
jgi:hypothetical protein